MPAAYTHHRFGEMCLDTMPLKLKEICQQYRELYDTGVHGPDVLFYHSPLKANEVNGYGQELHRWTGKEFFTSAKQAVQNSEDHKKAMMAYLLGFLAHFVLDSGCHDYINEEAEESGISHNMIESQYEAFLMEKDGKDPMKVDRSSTLKPGRENAGVIVRFFPFSEKEILKSMKGQKAVLHLLYSPTEVKKKLLRRMIRKLGLKGDFGDLFLDREHLSECEQMNEIIYLRQKAAAEIYPKLARNLIRFLQDKEDLNEYFNYDFEGELH